MQIVLLILAASAWLLIMALVHIISRYKHTPKSAALLFLIAAPSYYLGNRLVLRWFGSLWGSTVFYVVSIPVSIGIWITFAFFAVMIWRGAKLRPYDRALRSLKDKETALVEEMERRREPSLERPSEINGRERTRENQIDEISILQNLIDRWQMAPGKERIRGVKVQAWREEAACLGPEATERQRYDLWVQYEKLMRSEQEGSQRIYGRFQGASDEWEGEEFDSRDKKRVPGKPRSTSARGNGSKEAASDIEERARQLEAQIAVLCLRLLEIERGETRGRRTDISFMPADGGRAAWDTCTETPMTADPAARDAQAHGTLDSVRKEIEAWAKRRSEFLQKRILLD